MGSGPISYPGRVLAPPFGIPHPLSPDPWHLILALKQDSMEILVLECVADKCLQFPVDLFY